ETLEFPEVLPLLPVRDLVVFPYMIVPLFVARDVSLAAVNDAMAKDRLVFLAAQREAGEEDPTSDTIYDVGTVGMIMRVRKLSDGRVRLLVQGLAKAKVVQYLRHKPSFRVRVVHVEEPPVENSLEAEALMRTAKELLEKIAETGKRLPADILMVVGGIHEPGRLADLIASNLGSKVADAQAVLETQEPIARLRLLVDLLRMEKAVQQMQQKIQDQVKEEMNKTQREYYLREQLRQIQQELGETDDRAEELRELRLKLSKAGLPPEAEEEAGKQLKRLEQMNQDSAEAAVLRTYLEWLVELPWSKASEDLLDLDRAGRILDEDHYGLSKVKERIVEHLGVCKLKKAIRGPILCFAGPPGVGKTSLGRSIARALGRSFVRQSLGGVRDEAEIRGHRRTYVGAMPGRILQAMRLAKTRNPVFLLDEVDKLGQDFRGDPSAALLEVLDPEQNGTFRDHYLNLPFDLSATLFIATANLVEQIPEPLRDRMEIIEISGYTEEEKLAIARRHLVPKQLKENGLKRGQLVFGASALKRVIREYTREAGVRNLEREIASLCRKVARRVAEGRGRGRVRLEADDVAKLLGPPRYQPEPGLEANEVGQATGLAWTAAGGEVLHIEAQAMKGRGGLILTGQLGDVMKESAQAALTYIRAREKELGIPEDFFANHELHIHVPAGAIPKDGPSAGVTMACALVSAATGVPIKRSVAMTGEITLRGRVLPVGGVKEKVLAAVRQGLATVVLPADNTKDLAEIPAPVRARLSLVTARTVDDVLAVALERRPPRRQATVLAAVRASS
ncbi:MAG: endopeptidase La, partial [Deltaproteobacteria bacterium]|nr:endopeptidase La [Deltaproteobacteria bacterium]